VAEEIELRLLECYWLPEYLSERGKRGSSEEAEEGAGVAVGFGAEGVAGGG
jgi:hypothetical protein